VIAPHLDLLNRKLCDVAAGRCKRLRISMPPRHGKSYLVSQFFPSWYLGRKPNNRILFASYEANFAAGWGRKVRNAIKDHGAECFGIQVSNDSSAADRWDIAGHEGGMQTAGVGGALTGKGADLLIIDDPIKNAEEAASETMREKTWDWFGSTAYTRLEPGASAIIIQTRWHEDDLSGRIIEQQKDPEAEKWDEVVFPAIAEENDILGRKPGDPLWPARYDAEALDRIKRTIGSYQFAALYQQRPAPEEGGIFKRAWIRRYEVVGDMIHCDDHGAFRLSDCWKFGTMDLAISQDQSADYTVLADWACTPRGGLVLLDMERERMEGPDMPRRVKAHFERWNLDYFIIEAVQFQESLVQQVRRNGLPVKGVKPKGDKVSRARAASVRFEAGLVFLPKHADYLGAMENELFSFPNAAHDDTVDVTSYACEEVTRAYGTEAAA